MSPAVTLEHQRTKGRAYAERWSQFRQQGNAVVVISRSTPEPWSRWRSYFKQHGLDLQLELMANRTDMTVPCLDPRDFDAVPAAPDRRVKDD